MPASPPAQERSQEHGLMEARGGWSILQGLVCMCWWSWVHAGGEGWGRQGPAARLPARSMPIRPRDARKPGHLLAPEERLTSAVPTCLGRGDPRVTSGCWSNVTPRRAPLEKVTLLARQAGHAWQPAGSPVPACMALGCCRKRLKTNETTKKKPRWAALGGGRVLRAHLGCG